MNVLMEDNSQQGPGQPILQKLVADSAGRSLFLLICDVSHASSAFLCHSSSVSCSQALREDS